MLLLLFDAEAADVCAFAAASRGRSAIGCGGAGVGREVLFGGLLLLWLLLLLFEFLFPRGFVRLTPLLFSRRALLLLLLLLPMLPLLLLLPDDEDCR